ncbi:MAG TPA: hypothetical protein ENI87_01130, partial [bacterium]|nr:hypothetical protein [bacterium]
MSKHLVPSLVLLALAGCGGGGSSGTGTVQGLQAPQQVSIVEADGGVSSALLGDLLGVTGSDYETDQTQFWVEDVSMRALQTVNM